MLKETKDNYELKKTIEAVNIHTEEETGKWPDGQRATSH